jgi:NO-binding membrane sensor protein with MHYT domain
MNATAISAAADSSLMMWVMAAVVAIMTASICQGWLRQAQMTPTLRQNWRATLICALVLGTGFTTAVVLALAAEPLPFPLGYRLRLAPLLWLGAVLAFWPPLALLGSRFRWPHVIGAGVLLAAISVALPAGWVYAAGFRPGVAWRVEAATVAVVTAVVGMCVALFMVMSETARAAPRRTMWRLGAAVLMGMTLLASQQMLLAGTNLPAQVGSVFRTEVPSSLLCLVLGVVVPLVWSLLLLDLRLRRQEQRRLERREKRNRRHQMNLARESQSLVTRPAQAFVAQPKAAAEVNPSAGTAASQEG